MRLLFTLLLLFSVSCKKGDDDQDKSHNNNRVKPNHLPNMNTMAAAKPHTMSAMQSVPSNMGPAKKISVPAIDEKALMENTPLLSVPVKALVENTKSLGGEMWYGLYVMGKKMGWYTSVWELKTIAGKTYVVNNQKIHIELINLNGKKTSTISMEFVYQGFDKGLLVSQIISQNSPMETTTYTLKLTSSGDYVFTSKSALASAPDKPVIKTTRIKENPGTLSDSELATLYSVSQGPKSFAKSSAFKSRRFVHTHQMVSHEVLKILSSEKVAVSGVASTVHKALIISSIPRSRFNALLDATGKILEGQIGMFTIKREEKKTAMNIKAIDDLGFMAMIPSDIHDLTPDTKGLTLRMKGSYPKDINYFNTKRYRVAFDNSGFTLTLQKDTTDGLSLGAIPKEILPYTLPSPGVESDHAVIKEMAQKAVGAEKNPIGRVKALISFVSRTIEDKMFYDFDSAVNVAKFKKGDCTEHSLLFTALARALKIPARRVGGVGLVRIQNRRLFGYHMWVQVWLGRWIDVDPTWNQFPADVSHIMMGDVMDSQWIQSIGTLKIVS
ncbi:transglutaminase-like domain-containing protein, partial [Myxococcota bacterium]|nr:transglutaminase-like domain-containing protein [Myxococcota bacterium]